MKKFDHTFSERPECDEARSTEKPETLQKSDEQMKEQTRVFFREFGPKHGIQKPKMSETEMEKRFLDRVGALDVDMDPNPKMREEDAPLTAEELEMIEEDDAGYVNGQVLDYDNELGSAENTYKETGLHTGAIRWGPFAVEGSIEYISLPEGTILRRWGDEDGTFLSDPGTPYGSLELPTVQEKNPPHLYRVQKPFPVEISRVAVQPWNDGEKRDKQPALQYRAPAPVQELLNHGYLKSLDPSSEKETNEK